MARFTFPNNRRLLQAGDSVTFPGGDPAHPLIGPGGMVQTDLFVDGVYGRTLRCVFVKQPDGHVAWQLSRERAGATLPNLTGARVTFPPASLTKVESDTMTLPGGDEAPVPGARIDALMRLDGADQGTFTLIVRLTSDGNISEWADFVEVPGLGG